MNVILPSCLQQFVDTQVACGAYDSPSEVVGDALRLLRLHEKERAALLAAYREEVTVGIAELDRGESVPAEDVFQELRQRNARMAGQK